MKRRHGPVGVIWCPNARMGRSNGWRFPPAIDKHLRKITARQTVLHLFGGMARFGTRIDIDPGVRPDVIADAWLPPFGRDSFDVVVLDPPYHSINQTMKQHLLRVAAFVARKRVIWFHTSWIASGSGLKSGRSWLVRVGDSCQVRCVQEFNVTAAGKVEPRRYFERGPAVRYNRWLTGQLPFDYRTEK